MIRFSEGGRKSLSIFLLDKKGRNDYSFNNIKAYEENQMMACFFAAYYYFTVGKR